MPNIAGPVPIGPGLALRPDGRQIAEGLCDGVVRLVDPVTRRIEHTLALGAPAIDLAYSADGSRLAVVAASQLLIVDPATGGILARGPKVFANSIVFVPHTYAVAFVGPLGGGEWRFPNGPLTRFPTPKGVDAEPVDVAVTPGARRAVIALESGYDQRQPGLLLYDLARERAVASTSVSAGAVAVSPDGRDLAVAENAPDEAFDRIVLRNARTLAPVRVLATLPLQWPTAVAFSPDGTHVAYGTANGNGAVVPVTGGPPSVTFLGDRTSITQIGFSPDGRTVYTSSVDGAVRAWRATGLELARADVPNAVFSAYLTPTAADGFATIVGLPHVVVERWTQDGNPVGRPLELWTNPDVDADFIGSGGLIAGVIPWSQHSNTVRIQLWNVPQRRVVATVGPVLPTYSAEPVISPDGTTLAMDETDSSDHFDLVNLRTGRQYTLGTADCAEGYLPYASFSASSQFVATGTPCGEVATYDTTTGRRVSLVDTGEHLAWLALSPGGVRLAIASDDGTITVAATSTGRIIGRLTQNTYGVTSVAFSPNGRYLASSGIDDTVRIFDTRTLAELRVIPQPNPTLQVAFTNDGSDVLTLDDFGIVRRWDACTDCENPRALLALASSRVTRSLTAAERTEFGLG